MLYMKTRVTFRVEADVAEALRELPNQTRFVEDALRVGKIQRNAFKDCWPNSGTPFMSSGV